MCNISNSKHCSKKRNSDHNLNITEYKFFSSEYLNCNSDQGCHQNRLSLCLRERDPVLRQLRVTPLGFCLRVITYCKKILINLKKTTSSVLSVILINLMYTVVFKYNRMHSKHKQTNCKHTGCPKKHEKSVTNSISSL